MSAIFAWEEPPARTRQVPVGRKPQFADAFAALRDDQYLGKWARITEEPLDGSKAQSHAARIRNGHVTGIVPGEFDARDHEGHVFIAYRGAAGVEEMKPVLAQRAEAKAVRDAEKAAAKAAAEAAGESVPDADDADDAAADDFGDEVPEPADDPALFDADASDGASDVPAPAPAAHQW